MAHDQSLSSNELVSFDVLHAKQANSQTPCANLLATLMQPHPQKLMIMRIKLHFEMMQVMMRN